MDNNVGLIVNVGFLDIAIVCTYGTLREDYLNPMFYLKRGSHQTRRQVLPHFMVYKNVIVSSTIGIQMRTLCDWNYSVGKTIP